MSWKTSCAYIAGLNIVVIMKSIEWVHYFSKPKLKILLTRRKGALLFFVNSALLLAFKLPYKRGWQFLKKKNKSCSATLVRQPRIQRPHAISNISADFKLIGHCTKIKLQTNNI